MADPTLEIDLSDKSEEEVKQELIDRVLAGELFHINSIREIPESPWGPLTTYYNSGKFSYMFAMVDVDELLRLHDTIGHLSAHAYQDTVDRVQESIENGSEDEIPTPPLALEPETFDDNPLVYRVVHEGRSRAVGAKEAGLEEIPVLLSVRRPRR